MSLFPIYSLSQSAYGKAVHSLLGKGEYHAQKLYTEWFRTGKLVFSWVEPQARALVDQIVSLTEFAVAEVSSVQEDGAVRKFLLKYEDGLEAESVVIPMPFGNTLCISSQIGCRMGCAFCETAKMGLIRSLTVTEIVQQVFAAKFVLGFSIQNLVFMGMGEPFDNYDAVMQAISVLSNEGGVAIPLRNITVSTSGKVPEIYQFAKEASPSLRLAVSLNAPNDSIRSKLMPVNKEWDLAALKLSMQEYCAHVKRKIFIEYVLMAGVNDSLDAAEQVADYLEGLSVSINLIPYNAQRSGRLIPPTEEKMQEFKQYLQGRGFRVLLRLSRGRSIMAACGQLGNRALKELFTETEGKRIVSNYRAEPLWRGN